MALQWEALGYLMGGFAVFGLIGLAAVYNDKPSKKPFVSHSRQHSLCLSHQRAACFLDSVVQACSMLSVGPLPCPCSDVFNALEMVVVLPNMCFLCQVPREFPFDNLKEELGGGFGPAALEERMRASIHTEEDE